MCVQMNVCLCAAAPRLFVCNNPNNPYNPNNSLQLSSSSEIGDSVAFIEARLVTIAKARGGNVGDVLAKTLVTDCIKTVLDIAFVREGIMQENDFDDPVLIKVLQTKK
jgi:hypothetical protein